MTMPPVRIGVLGAGYFGTLHALTVNSLSEAQLCAIVESSPYALSQLPASLHEIPQSTSPGVRSSGSLVT